MQEPHRDTTEHKPKSVVFTLGAFYIAKYNIQEPKRRGRKPKHRIAIKFGDTLLVRCEEVIEEQTGQIKVYFISGSIAFKQEALRVLKQVSEEEIKEFMNKML